MPTLPQSTQLIAIACRLLGHPIPYKPGQRPFTQLDFSGPYGLCWIALDRAQPGCEREMLYGTISCFFDPDAFIQQILDHHAQATRHGHPSLGYPSPSDYPSLGSLASSLIPISWLWPGWIPRGFITLFAAESGTGKSFVALDLAHRLLSGLPFPDGQSFTHRSNGSPVGPPNGVSSIVYVDSEAVPQLIYARLSAWGTPLSNIYLFQPGDGAPVDLALPEHRQSLTSLVTSTVPDLIVIDSLTSVTSNSSANLQACRALMEYLYRLAQHFDCGLLLIHNLRKSSHPASRRLEIQLNDIFGPGVINNLSRSILGLTLLPALDIPAGLPFSSPPTSFDPLIGFSTLAESGSSSSVPDEMGISDTFRDTALPPPDSQNQSFRQYAWRRLSVLKTNLGPFPPPLAFQFVTLDGQPLSSNTPWSPDPVRLDWGEPPALPIEPTILDACTAWLLSLLQSEPRPFKPSEVLRLARQQGFHPRTVYRARARLSSLIRDTHGHHHPDNAWRLSH